MFGCFCQFRGCLANRWCQGLCTCTKLAPAVSLWMQGSIYMQEKFTGSVHLKMSYSSAVTSAKAVKVARLSKCGITLRSAMPQTKTNWAVVKWMESRMSKGKHQLYHEASQFCIARRLFTTSASQHVLSFWGKIKPWQMRTLIPRKNSGFYASVRPWPLAFLSFHFCTRSVLYTS